MWSFLIVDVGCITEDLKEILCPALYFLNGMLTLRRTEWTHFSYNAKLFITKEKQEIW